MTDVQLTTRAIRIWLLIAGTLVLIIGTALFLAPEQTDRLFAWTIAPPNNRYLTAAFLGAAYWAGSVLEFLAARERVWANARVAIPAVWVFTTLTLIATLMHLNLFHLNPPLGTPAGPLTVSLTYVWLAVYAIVPIAVPIMVAIQRRAPGGDPPRLAPLPGWLRAILIIQAALLIGLGTIMFLAPPLGAPLWPWALTPLTSRAVAAWLVGIGVAAAQMAWENDLVRVRVAFRAYVAIAVLQAIALLRYLGDVRLDDPRLWLYLVGVTSFLVVGLLGLWLQPSAAQTQGR
ncbi:MAG: hypothetical protein KIS91_08825 [Anaerolineae bacterium]|nr:hypothetical protein [Anaerolineae bacterium]